MTWGGWLDPATQKADQAKAAAKAAKAPPPPLWMVHGKHYDLAEFVKSHPGGELVLGQSIGTDVTALVESHHFGERVWKVLAKYETTTIPKGTTPIEPMGYTFSETGFFRTLKRRFVQRMHSAGRDPRDGPPWTYGVRVFASLAAYVLLWGFCCTQTFWWPAVLGAAYFRCVLTGIGHEAIHGRYGGFLFHLFDFAFLFPSEAWHFEHVMLHHPHTKRDGVDPDEDMAPLLRLSTAFPWKPIHRIQVAMSWVMGSVASWGTFVENHLVNRVAPILGLIFFLVHIAPLFFAPDGGWAATLLVSGIASSITLNGFHLSHIIEETALTNGTQFSEDVDWGEHQVRSSANWDSAWYGLSGMLEYQIEHHLFPSVPYDVQRNVLRPLVKEMTKEFDLPYMEFTSVCAGVMAHMRYLTKLGSPLEKRVEG